MSQQPPPIPTPDDERAFLERYDVSQFDRPSVAVDVALLSVIRGQLRVLLIRREEHPDRGKWALPGGFVGMSESLDAAAERVIRTKAGLRDVFIEQLYTFGSPGRDPRTRVISVAYYALVDAARVDGGAGGGSVDEGAGRVWARIHVPWSGETGGAVEVSGKTGRLPLAFDHDLILGTAVKRLRGKLNYTPIGFQLLPPEFTLRRLRQVHESILGKKLNKDAFRRRMLATGHLEATGEREGEVGHRPAELYRFTMRSAV